MALEYGSAIAVAIAAGMAKANIAASPHVRLGVAALTVFVYASQSWTNNPRSLSKQHYASGARYKQLQKKYELMEADLAIDTTLDQKAVRSLLFEYIDAKCDVDKDIGPYDWDWEAVRAEHVDGVKRMEDMYR